MTPRSGRFDDIYFSPEDGLAETRHVFLDGNNLPSAWRARARFTIAETGFGTGLNFLAAWALFEKTATPRQRLHYVSFEQYPLVWDEISRTLGHWRGEFGGRMDRLRALYPLRVPGFHRLMLNEQVTLTLIFDDVNDALPRLDAPEGIDAWFLDGFAPAKNPQMWTDRVFAEMARLSHDETTLATFTVAGIVRRGLEKAGFSVEKKSGYGRKRQMLAGRFSVAKKQKETRRPARVAVIGGGLAGTSAAFVLKRSGIAPVIFEREAALAPGASGNPRGLYNPRLSALRTPESDFYTAGFAQAIRTFGELRGIDWTPCGSLHLATNDDRERKFSGALTQWGWHKAHMRGLDPEEASRIAGAKLNRAALFLPDAGAVSPAALCAAYADGVETRLNAGDFNRADFDAVVLACGAAAKAIPGLADLPIHAVQGQMTLIRPASHTAGLKTNLCFGGYLSPPHEGLQALGATFRRDVADDTVRPEDHEDNLDKLTAVLPGPPPQIAGGRAGLRTSSRDHFPLTGLVGENLDISTAHGSHGLVSTLAASHLLADLMTEAPCSLPDDTVRALNPLRFTQGKKKQS